MTSAADSAARHAPHGESVRVPHAEAEQLRAQGVSEASPHLPVFAAFDELGLTGRDIAEFSAVSAPTLSKWRSAKARVPGKRLVFLTLVLAHLLDEIQALSNLEAQCISGTGTSGTDVARMGAGKVCEARIHAAKAYLAYQDVLNQSLNARDVRDAGVLFRSWWTSTAARQLWEKRFKPESGET